MNGRDEALASAQMRTVCAYCLKPTSAAQLLTQSQTTVLPNVA
jgi:hypothetical protein